MFISVCFHFVIYFDIFFVIKEVYNELTPASIIHVRVSRRREHFPSKISEHSLGKIMLVSRVISGC
jgi:hypothetical protein